MMLLSLLFCCFVDDVDVDDVPVVDVDVADIVTIAVVVTVLGNQRKDKAQRP